jgi:hypothetical protein
MEQEKWINEVIGSLNKLETPTPSPELFAKIEDKINNRGTKVISMKSAIAIAASITLLAVFNIWSIQKSNNSISKSANLESLTASMGMQSSDQLYEQ